MVGFGDSLVSIVVKRGILEKLAQGTLAAIYLVDHAVHAVQRGIRFAMKLIIHNESSQAAFTIGNRSGHFLELDQGSVQAVK